MDILKGLHKEFGWLIWGLVAIGALWAYNGGTERESARGGIYIKPLAPIDTGEVYGKRYDPKTGAKKETLDLPVSPANVVKNVEAKIGDFLAQSEEAKQIHATSLLAKRISFDGIAGAKSSDSQSEYLRIVASAYAPGPIALSGLLLRGIGLDSNVIIPRAAELPVLGSTVARKDIFLPPGGRAVISSGISPIGTSFRVNKCSGYLSQFQTYVPDIRKDCPLPADEVKKTDLKREEACLSFAEELPRCRIYQGEMPSGASSACRAFVAEELNYNSCVEKHENDKDFYSNEWRVYLGSETQLWKDKGEIIRLFDAKENVVDAITY